MPGIHNRINIKLLTLIDVNRFEGKSTTRISLAAKMSLTTKIKIKQVRKTKQTEGHQTR